MIYLDCGIFLGTPAAKVGIPFQIYLDLGFSYQEIQHSMCTECVLFVPSLAILGAPWPILLALDTILGAPWPS